jgi:hypothetical protein
MLLNVLGANQDVINVNDKPRVFYEDIFHSLLKLTRRIFEAERHCFPLVMTMWNNKGYFMPIFRCQKTRLEVELAEDGFSSYPLQ